MGKRDALARLAFGSPPPCDRTRRVLLVEFGDNPPALTATGGELVLEMPWKLDPDRLQPIAYRYRTGL
jgi:hypothetical protein